MTKKIEYRKDEMTKEPENHFGEDGNVEVICLDSEEQVMDSIETILLTEESE